jgi:hypothetical protein
MLAESDLAPFFDNARREWFRLEGLAEYAVDVEQERFRAYLAGEPYDPEGEPRAWYEEIRRRVAEGIVFRKVRILRGPLSEYERWECEWSYPATERAGQRTHVIDLAETPNPPQLPGYDWWMFDEAVVLRMHYADDGGFVGADEIRDPAEVAAHVRYRDAALRVAVPFPVYWHGHPHYHRQHWTSTG